MEIRTIRFTSALMVLFCASLLAASAQAQTGGLGAPQAAKTSPPTMIGPTPPTAQEKAMALAIANYATAQCGGKDADAAPDCRVKALWAAARCPPVEAPTNMDAKIVPTFPCTVTGSGFEYDVASIKPHKDDSNGGMMMVGATSDGFRSVNGTVTNMVQNAYSTGLQMEITGAPSWMNETHYDVEAKYATEVVDALKRLGPEDRQFVRRYMMQALLKDRANLAVHVETKEVPAYDLVIGKSGSKLKEADPNSKENGSMRMQPDQGKLLITAKGMQLANLARNLSQFAGRPVFDKTGLTGIYDLTLSFAPNSSLTAAAPGEGPTGNAPATPADPGGPSVMAAVEDQLGLKLVPSRGPKMVVVIEHVDKPDAN